MTLNVVLDLDSTLISSISDEEEHEMSDHDMKYRLKQFYWINMGNYYKVFERPGLQEFLTYLFKHYRVSVWTAASKAYALFIIKHIILRDPKRKLFLFLFSHHCRISRHDAGGSKDLSLLWKDFKIPGMTPYNTVIVDDLKSVCDIQPDKCILVKPFNVKTDKEAEYDNELMESVIPKLQTHMN